MRHPHARLACERLPPHPHGDNRGTRIGILGGSFNPAHEGHLHIARMALRRLRLDQVWLLVSPGNPLKEAAGMAPLAERLAHAQTIADGKRIIATDIERHLHTRFTYDTLRVLKLRFPRARFVWLMGADNLAQFSLWRGWMGIARIVPFAVLPRPTYNRAAAASQAAVRLAPARLPARQAPVLADLVPPAWVFLGGRQSALSATAIRRAAAGEDQSPESQRPPPPPAPRNPNAAPRNRPPR
jgi:nicotinate-nucleotide adenylyltransferase